MLAALLGLLGACSPKPLENGPYAGRYFYKGSTVYYHKPSNVLNTYQKVPGADKESFQVLHHSVGKDKNQVFYRDVPQGQVHHPSFRLHGGRLKDKDKVYRRVAGQKLLQPIDNPDMDPETFENLDWDHDQNTDYWDKDRAHYYFKRQTLEVDYETFALANTHFLTDKNSLYTHLGHWKFKLLGALGNDFKVLNDHTVRNQDTLYYFNPRGGRQLRKVAVAPRDSIGSLHDHIVRVNDVILLFGTPLEASGYDAESFAFVAEETFGGQSMYSKDKHQVYLNHNVILDAHPDSFTVLKGNYAKDGATVYYKGEACPNADPKTIASLGWGYAKDKDKVYLRGSVLENADAASFGPRPDDPTRFRDKNYDF
ncbi:DKNYY domain-containing protein [Maribacter sp. 2307ULW6-5]|uniref:DKNYY domain-containing protein n=1 Tax=Maribacter sp. 2307ULW6-5 TaxID=3386275 RepID=UPI0039BD366A